jgi:hypothetical protein
MKRVAKWLSSGAMLLLIVMNRGRAAEPSVSIRLGAADAKAAPAKDCCSKTGGGNIDVRQTAPDTVLITMTGAAAAGSNPFSPSQAAFNFDLHQEFSIIFENPKIRTAQLCIQGQVTGVLRCPHKGGAGSNTASAAIHCAGFEGHPLVALCLPAQVVGPKQNLSVHLRERPLCIPIQPGCYTLHQTWSLWASHPSCGFPGKESSSEFAPAPALDPAWISYAEPFHGVAKKDFGFQVIMKVVPVTQGR